MILNPFFFLFFLDLLFLPVLSSLGLSHHVFISPHRWCLRGILRPHRLSKCPSTINITSSALNMVVDVTSNLLADIWGINLEAEPLRSLLPDEAPRARGINRYGRLADGLERSLE
ncbi:hypothetical protein BO82DRAFT_54661 [Aspergillus uvarum CBS 121591]|uniref:Uncharacterized protein n=1 Tax=Aspergillus uvarum CBS 121591 TaxID=1448315 RepID=A0A319CRU5_9EURO|nr:hypothetical protein BO82DRAFT_54661 [Aspergillus uvarum CBS 121591]PYH86941.1 hypothetical protein BO82DRAFT_54661 [Aspergillus uvarum CBS 121591]